MTKNTADYWRRRAEQIMKEEQKKDNEASERIKTIISNMIQDIEKEILAFYTKYATKEGVSVEEAKKKIDSTDIHDFEYKVKGYVKNQDFSDEANKLLRQYNTKMYVSREQLLKQQITAILAYRTATLEQEFYYYLQSAIQREILRQSGILGESVILKPSLVKAIINSSFQNVSWSKRLWKDMDQTRKIVERTVSHTLLRGRHPNEFVSELRKKLDVGNYKARRLLLTETARAQTEAQKIHYEETLGKDAEYEYVAMIDNRTTKTCKKLDGKKFKVVDMVPGINAPPMHPFCRSVTIPAVTDWREEFFKKRKGKYSLNNFIKEDES